MGMSLSSDVLRNGLFNPKGKRGFLESLQRLVSSAHVCLYKVHLDGFNYDSHEPEISHTREIAPYHNLLFAILDRAIRDIWDNDRCVRREVLAWFRSPKRGYFDFRGLCEVIGIDSECIILKIKEIERDIDI